VIYGGRRHKQLLSGTRRYNVWPTTALRKCTSGNLSVIRCIVTSDFLAGLSFAPFASKFSLTGGFTMRKFAIYALAGILSLSAISVASAQVRGQKPTQIPPIQSPGAHTPTPLGFSTLLCVADALVGGVSLPGDPIVLFGGQVIIEATSAVVTSNGLSAINVNITHGKSSSEHTITFIDTDSSGTLNCGDTIVSVS
jgi:hypothetical protein